MDFPVYARERKMHKITSHVSNNVLKGMFLLALVASADVFAEPRSTPIDEAVSINGAGRNGEQAASLGTAGADTAVKLQNSNPGALAKPGAGTSARVYLDDYQRIPQRVSKQHPTKPYWLGKKNPSRQGSG
jgi:hypothetical protein